MSGWWTNLLWIFLGGGLGSVMRYSLGWLMVQRLGLHFVSGTLLVNLLGSFLLGIFVSHFQRTGNLNTPLALMLTIGFCGGFTTFSTFSIENLNLFRSEEWLSLLLYSSLSIIGGFGLAYIAQIGLR